MDSSRHPWATGPGASLRTLPVEITCHILARIMVNCTHDDLRDLYNAVRTSSWLYQIFLENRSYLLTLLGRDSLHHFDLALAAVRATRLVEDALRTDQLVRAQDIILSTRNIRSGDANAAPPTLAEFSAIILLDKFTEAARNGILDTRNKNLDQLLGGLTLQPIALDAWSRRFHMSTYRLVIAGAALSGAYLEPFLQTRIPQPREFLARIFHSTLMFVDWQSSGNLDLYEASNEDIEYFCRFPLYHCRDEPAGPNRQDTWDIFSPVIDWLLEDMKYEEVEAERRSLSQDTIMSMAPWLTREPSEVKELPQWQREEGLRAIDSVPRWPIHRQIHQLVRLARELSSSVETDRWGRGLLIPELKGNPEVAEFPTFRRADGRQTGGNRRQKPVCSPLAPSDIAAARVVRYGLFVPEVILAHIQTDRGSCKSHGRSLLGCHAAHERGMPQAWKPQSQPYLEAPRTASNGTFEIFFGGTAGRILKLERVFFNLFIFRDGRRRDTTHPGVLTRLAKLVPSDPPENEYRMAPLSEAIWDDFWGDQLNVLAYSGLIESPEYSRGQAVSILAHLEKLDAKNRASGPEAIPGSYTIF